VLVLVVALVVDLVVVVVVVVVVLLLLQRQLQLTERPTRADKQRKIRSGKTKLAPQLFDLRSYAPLSWLPVQAITRSARATADLPNSIVDSI
jgi:hypothetical protein